MNSKLLKKICESKSRIVFEEAKHSIINNLFKINDDYVEQVIEFDIKQKLGGSIFKEYFKTNTLDNLALIIAATEYINSYKELVILTFKNWCKNQSH